MNDLNLENQPIIAAANIELEPTTLRATAKTRVNLSIHHLFAACRCTARIGRIEALNKGKEFGEFWEEILAEALSVAMLTVASLESFGNELYFEGSAISSQLNSATAALVLPLIDRQPILRKFDLVMAVRSGKTLATGHGPAQDIQELILLRNAATHFRAEWFSEQKEHDKLSNRLKGKFTQSPFLQNESIFPRAWASHSFACWAVRSVVAFLQQFFKQCGLECPVTRFRKRISELSELSF